MKRIVIIDDSIVVLNSASAALSDAGYEVTTMTEPSREEIVGDRAVDLLLVDVNMPEAFGDDVSRFLKEVWKIPAPIYLYSSLAEAELARRVRDARADGFICKAWGTEGLVATVRQILDEQENEERAAPAGATGGIETVEAHEPDRGRGRDQGEYSIYKRFASRCEERRDRIGALLDRLEESGDDRKASTQIALEIHDWIGEAKLIGLDKLSAAASDLDAVLGRWGTAFSPRTQGIQLRKWISELSEISRQLSLEAPDSEIARKLQKLRSELTAELEISEPAGARTKRPTSEALPVVPDRRRILVLDDSPIVGEALALELGSKGHKVQLAASYDQFMRFIESFSPEIIFIDINLPEIPGDEVCRRLRMRSGTQSVPIIFLSSLSDEELSVLAERAGADGYLSKRHGMDELIKYLDDLMSEVIF
jgi:DNA-binding response OmpR family regulator